MIKLACETLSSVNMLRYLPIAICPWLRFVIEIHAALCLAVVAPDPNSRAEGPGNRSPPLMKSLPRPDPGQGHGPLWEHMYELK